LGNSFKGVETIEIAIKKSIICFKWFDDDSVARNLKSRGRRRKI
jgi:hypothetical protein